MTDETTARDRVDDALWQAETWTALPDANGTAKVLAAEVRRLREHKTTFQNVVIFTSEHVAAICAELGLSYEAETETVIAEIKRLRALAGAPTADKATREVVEIWRSVSMVDVEVRRRWPGLAAGLDRLAAAPEGVDAADELARLREQQSTAVRAWARVHAEDRAELAAAQSAIQRVRVAAMETLRLCREAGVPESSAHLHPNAVLRVLDGDTTEES